MFAPPIAAPILAAPIANDLAKRDAQAAALAVRLQADGVPPYRAMRQAKLILNDRGAYSGEVFEFPRGIPATSSAHPAATNPLRSAGAGAVGAPPLSPFTSTAAEAFGDARETERSLARMVPYTKRKADKGGLWGELTRLDAEAEVVAAREAIKRAAATRQELADSLAKQLRMQADLRRKEEAVHEAFASSIRSKAAEHASSVEAAARERARVAALTLSEQTRVNKELEGRKATARERELAADRRTVERFNELERREQMRMLEKRTQAVATMAVSLAANAEALREKAAAVERRRADDCRVLAEAETVANEKERRRLAEVSAREDAIKRKLDRMQDLYEASSKPEAEAAARAEREAVARRRVDDAAAAKRAALHAKDIIDVKLTLARQVAEHDAARQRERAEVSAEYVRVVTDVREHEASTRAAAQKRAAWMSNYKADVERQMLSDVDSKRRPDESELERALNATFIERTRVALAAPAPIRTGGFGRKRVVT